MLKASRKLKTKLKFGKSIEKHQNTSKKSENFRSLQYFGRLPDIPEPNLHEKMHQVAVMISKDSGGSNQARHGVKGFKNLFLPLVFWVIFGFLLILGEQN